MSANTPTAGSSGGAVVNLRERFAKAQYDAEMRESEARHASSWEELPDHLRAHRLVWADHVIEALGDLLPGPEPKGARVNDLTLIANVLASEIEQMRMFGEPFDLVTAYVRLESRLRWHGEHS